MIKINIVCPSCKGNATSTITQGIEPINGRLLLCTHDVCSQCGYLAEIDDYGMPPEEIRTKFLKEEGTYKLVIDTIRKEDRLKLTKVLRSLFGMSTIDALELVKKLPGVVYKGTKVEVEWVSRAIEEKNINTEIVKASDIPADIPPDIPE